MNTISREELKGMLERKDSFKLVMTLGEDAYRKGHIPGSINISSIEQAEGLISPEEEIVVYCHDENCPASKTAYQMLVSHGFTNVRRFAGGIREWQEVGYPLETELKMPQDKHNTAVLSQPIDEHDHIQGRSIPTPGSPPRLLWPPTPKGSFGLCTSTCSGTKER